MRVLICLTLLVHGLMAVRLGISKAQPTTLATTTTITLPTTTLPTTSKMPEEMSTTTMEVEGSSSLADGGESTTPSTPEPTMKPTFPPFVVPTFSTKRPSKKKNLKKGTTTTTTTLAPFPDFDEDEDEGDEENPNVSAASNSTSTKVDNRFCFCDLNENVCDVNCCCDPECPKEALQIFDCFVQPHHQELHKRLEDFNYQHGLPSCKLNDGWLCVFRTNSPAKKKNDDAKVLLDTSQLPKWPNTMMPVLEKPASVAFYKFAERLQILNMTSGEIQHFELPFPFNPPFCHIKDPLRFLQPIRRSCLLGSGEELQALKMYLIDLADTSKLLLQPRHEEEDDKPKLIQIDLRICNSSHCHDVLPNNTDTVEELTLGPSSSIKIKVIHNYTQIKGMFVELHEEDAVELWLRIEVEFHEQNATQTEAVAIAISGPLGYLQGEPVIKAKFMDHHEGAEHNRGVIDYFAENSTRSRQLHSLHTFKRSQCSREFSYNAEATINYGINMQNQCKLKFPEAIPATSSNLTAFNFTKTCAKLQTLAIQHLTGGLSDIELLGKLLISQLGRPANQTDRWLPLQLKNYEFVPLIGEYNEKAATFACRNFILNIGYDFQIDSGHIEQGVERQSVIKSAAIYVGPRIDLEFAIDEAIEVPLMVSTMFYNIATDGGFSLKAFSSLICFLSIYVIVINK